MLITLFIILILFVVLDVAAMRWGVNSAEKLGSCEWDRRWNSATSRIL